MFRINSKDVAKADQAVDRLLSKANADSSPVYTTTESICEGERIIAQSRINATENIAKAIKHGEYVTLSQLQAALRVKRAAISNAVAAGRIFAVIGPSGESFYPIFFADPTLDLRVIAKIVEALGSLPGATKYHFFTSKFTALGESPLDALRKGKVGQVSSAALSYAER